MTKNIICPADERYWPFLYRALSRSGTAKLYDGDLLLHSKRNVVPMWLGLKTQLTGSLVQTAPDNVNTTIMTYKPEHTSLTALMLTPDESSEPVEEEDKIQHKFENGDRPLIFQTLVSRVPLNQAGIRKSPILLNGLALDPSQITPIKTAAVKYDSEKTLDSDMYVSLNNPALYRVESLHNYFSLLTVLANLQISTRFARHTKQYIITAPVMPGTAASVVSLFGMLSLDTPGIFGNIHPVFAFYLYVDYRLAGNPYWPMLRKAGYAALLPPEPAWLKYVRLIPGLGSEMPLYERLRLIYCAHVFYYPELSFAKFEQGVSGKTNQMFTGSRNMFIKQLFRIWGEMFDRFYDKTRQLLNSRPQLTE